MRRLCEFDVDVDVDDAGAVRQSGRERVCAWAVYSVSPALRDFIGTLNRLDCNEKVNLVINEMVSSHSHLASSLESAASCSSSPERKGGRGRAYFFIPILLEAPR